MQKHLGKREISTITEEITAFKREQPCKQYLFVYLFHSQAVHYVAVKLGNSIITVRQSRIITEYGCFVLYETPTQRCSSSW